MIVDVIMPKMGESITEGTILEWTKKPGEYIKKDETLLEISTDKVDSEIPSSAEGTLVEILFQPNDVVEVGVVIARINTEADAVTDVPESTEIPEETLKESPAPPPQAMHGKSDISGNKKYSPLVRSIAEKENISTAELAGISGSGNYGRVTKKDILLYLNNRAVKKPGALPHIPESLLSSKLPADSPAPVPLTNRVEPMDRVRQKIADHMLKSLQTSAHVYSTNEVDVTGMVNFRAKYKDKFVEKYGIRLTYTPIILQACINAIREFPRMNASLEGENIINHDHINMGVAVALPDDNLIVPVIKAAEDKSFLGLARATADLAERARSRKLEPDEIFGSTFSVTNPGVFGSLFGMAIINQPNVGILSVGSIHKRPVVKETEFGDVIVARSMLYLTLSYDHRLIDGAYGTKFLTRVSSLLENFDGTGIF